MAPRLYEVTTETVMPHLEESLRYAPTREQRCLSQQELVLEFSILSHDALKGCKLNDETRVNDSLTFLLTCDGGHGTTGTAHWVLGAEPIRGSLDVRLGGKNMTFSQRVTARLLGECGSKVK